MTRLFHKNLNKHSDTELMLLLRNGSKEAFSVLYERYAGKLVKFFYRMFNKDLGKAEDFMHDLFVKIIEQPEAFDPGKRFDTWVFHSAYNMCKNEYKKMNVREAHQAHVLSTSSPFTEERVVRLDGKRFTEELNHRLDALDEKHRTTFLLRYQQELSHAEIARIMDCPEGTVKSRTFYALKFLSEQLKVFDPKEN
jgi:RNA polymerase sigma-70 factor, ECF subfamily